MGGVVASSEKGLAGADTVAPFSAIHDNHNHSCRLGGGDGAYRPDQDGANAAPLCFHGQPFMLGNLWM